jgi:hypothetical protein
MSAAKDELRVQYDPQECANCDDPRCLYSHHESWSIWSGGKYVSGGYRSESEATEAISGFPPFCSIYGEPCLHDGQECDERCLREVRSAEDSDEASDRGDFECHQARDR